MIRNIVCKIVKQNAIIKDKSAYKHVRECNCLYNYCKERNIVPPKRLLDKLSNSNYTNNSK